MTAADGDGVATSVVVLDRAREALRAGQIVLLPLDAGYALCGDLFEVRAVDRLKQAAHAGALPWQPVCLIVMTEHIEALATDLNEDARVAVRRLMPGPLALALRPSAMMPAHGLLESGLVAVSVPAIATPRLLIAEIGHPLLAVSCPFDHGADMVVDAGPRGALPPAILDATRRPAAVVRAGVPAVQDIERYLLVEGNV